MNTDIGNKIRNLRKVEKLSQERFGKKLGLSGKAISAYETGKVLPPLRVLENISNIYEINLGQMQSSYKNRIRGSMRNILKELEALEGILENA